MLKVMPVLFAMANGRSLLAQSPFGLSSIRWQTFTIVTLAFSETAAGVAHQDERLAGNMGQRDH